MNEKLICPQCGSENETESIFCGACGTRLKNETLPASSEEPAEETVSEEVTPEETTPEAATSEETGSEEVKAETTTEEVKPEEVTLEEAVSEETPEPAQAEVSVKKFPVIPVLVAAGIVLAVALLTMLTNFVSGGGSGLSPKAYPIVLQNSRDNHFIVAGYGDEPWIIEKERDRYVNSEISKNGAGTLAAVDHKEYSMLYYITEKTELALELSTINGMTISDNGNAFLYIIQNTTGKNDYTVNFYRDGNEETLSETAYGKGFAVSPNGSAVSFTDGFDDTEDTYTTYVKVGNTTTELGRNMEVVALADNAKYIYYYKNEAFYIQKGFDETTRVKIADSDGLGRPIVIGYNADYSQVLCVESEVSIGSRTYFSEKGGEPVKISNEWLHLTDPGKSISDLKKAVYYTIEGNDNFSYTLYTLNKDLESERIAKDIGEYLITEDGKFIFYQKGEDIYKIPVSGGENEKAEKIIEDAAYFEITKNGNAIYYASSDDELYSFKNGESTLVTYDFDAFSVSENGDVYYLDGTEVYKSTGGRGKMIGEADIALGGIARGESRIITHESGYLILYFYLKDNADGVMYNAAETFISKDQKNFINIADM
jgi:hypothetical protein